MTYEKILMLLRDEDTCKVLREIKKSKTGYLTGWRLLKLFDTMPHEEIEAILRDLLCAELVGKEGPESSNLDDAYYLTPKGLEYVGLIKIG